MKLRCEKNSLRFRLRKSEIEELKNAGSLRTEVYFSPGLGFSYEIWLDMSADVIRAMHYGSHIAIALPLELALGWINTEQVGIEFFQKIDKEQRLHILIEKDFPCKDRPDENKADFFIDLASASTC